MAAPASAVSKQLMPVYGQADDSLSAMPCGPASKAWRSLFGIGADFHGGDPVALVPEDNLFHGHELIPQLKSALARASGGNVFAYPVRHPDRYVLPGFYLYDASVVERAQLVKPSACGELEITSLHSINLSEGACMVG